MNEAQKVERLASEIRRLRNRAAIAVGLSEDLERDVQNLRTRAKSFELELLDIEIVVHQVSEVMGAVLLVTDAFEALECAP